MEALDLINGADPAGHEHSALAGQLDKAIDAGLRLNTSTARLAEAAATLQLRNTLSHVNATHSSH